MKSRYLSFSILSFLLLSMPLTTLAAKPSNPSLEQRVAALEELTLQQQIEIDQNTADILALSTAGSRFTLMDSDSPPKPVGEIVSWEGSIADLIVKISVAGYDFVLSVQYPEYIRANVGYFEFESTDCSGTPYLIEGDYDRFPLDEVFVKRMSPTNDYLALVPFVRSGDATVISRMSRLNNSGTCVQVSSSTQNVAPLIQIADDLLLTYPRPYTVGVE